MNKKFILPNKELQIIDTNTTPIEITLSPVLGKPQSIINNGLNNNTVTVNYGSSVHILYDGDSATFTFDGDNWIAEKFYDHGTVIGHEWNGTQLRVQNSNGIWGNFVELQGPPGVGSGGVGVPSGGNERQVLGKASNTDYDLIWTSGSAGATGGGDDEVFYENDTNVTTNYTITTGKNAMTAGPIEINDGVTVTIPDGSVWTIV